MFIGNPREQLQREPAPAPSRHIKPKRCHAQPCKYTKTAPPPATALTSKLSHFHPRCIVSPPTPHPSAIQIQRICDAIQRTGIAHYIVGNTVTNTTYGESPRLILPLPHPPAPPSFSRPCAAMSSMICAKKTCLLVSCVRGPAGCVTGCACITSFVFRLETHFTAPCSVASAVSACCFCESSSFFASSPISAYMATTCLSSSVLP